MSGIPISEIKEVNFDVRVPLEENPDGFADGITENIISAVPAKRRKRANDSVSDLTFHTYCSVSLIGCQTKMYSFLSVRPAVLDEIVSLDGPGEPDPSLCHSCLNDQPAPLYRCLECSYSSLCCGECILELHMKLPLHRLEVRSHLNVLRFAHISSSTGGMGSSTEPPSILSDSFATLGTMVTHVPSDRRNVSSPSLTPTVGTKCESRSAAVIQVPHGANATDNCFACAGTRRRSTVLERPFPLISSKHTTKSPSKENSICTTSISPSCKNRTIKDGQRQ